MVRQKLKYNHSHYGGPNEVNKVKCSLALKIFKVGQSTFVASLKTEDISSR